MGNIKKSNDYVGSSVTDIITRGANSIWKILALSGSLGESHNNEIMWMKYGPCEELLEA